jgi:hypothetical protein
MKQHQEISELINIRYQGLHPSESMSDFLESEMRALHAQGPADALLHAAFMRLAEHDYKANIQISSKAGDFFATAHGKNLNDVVKKTTGQIHRQFEKWKTQKFETEDPRSFRSGYDENEPISP